MASISPAASKPIFVGSGGFAGERPERSVIRFD
jgi:hypothetical protein